MCVRNINAKHDVGTNRSKKSNDGWKLTAGTIFVLTAVDPIETLASDVGLINVAVPQSASEGAGFGVGSRCFI